MRARWYTLVETNRDHFTLNKSYRSLYARKLMYEHPEEFGNGFLRHASWP
jgi:hypothetical protein